MTGIQKRSKGELTAQSTGMLKHQPPEQFKELLMAMILKCIKLNMDPIPDGESLIGLVDELYELLSTSWKGVTPEQLWATLKHGMAKGGAYRIRINYPTVANWVLHQRVMNPHNKSEKDQPAPSINEQAETLLSGLAEYRKRIKDEKGKADSKGKA